MRVKHDRSVQTLFCAATILIVLGAGNLFFGHSKLTHYEQLLSVAAHELTTTHDYDETDLITPTVNIDQQTQFMKRLKARVDFYSLVVLGGRCFLALAGISLLGILLKRSISGEDEPVFDDENKDNSSGTA